MSYCYGCGEEIRGWDMSPHPHYCKACYVMGDIGRFETLDEDEEKEEEQC